MKHICIISIIILLLACNQHKYQNLLNKAETQLVINPDSALKILKEIPTKKINASSNVFKTLLYYRILFKQNKIIMPDSALIQITQYYKCKNDTKEKAEALFYLGLSYYHTNERTKAISAYLDAYNISKRMHNYELTAYISSYIADFYSNSNLFTEAIKRYKDAEINFGKAENYRSQAIALRDIGMNIMLNDSSQYSLKYLYKADSIASILKDYIVLSSIKNHIACAYFDMHEYDKAEKYFLLSIQLDPQNNYNNFLSLSKIYIKKNNYKKAISFLNNAEYKNPDIYIKANILMDKSRIEEHFSHPQKALLFMKEYNILKDSIIQKEQKAEVLEIEKRYEHELVSKENYVLKIKWERNITFIILLIIGCTFLIALYFIKNRMKNKRIDLQQKEIDNKDCLIRQQTSIVKQIKYNLILRSEISKKIQKLSQTHLTNFQRLNVDFGNYILEDKDWINLQEEIDNAYPSFTSKVQSSIPQFIQNDIHFLYLLKMELETPELSILLNIDPESVNRKRYRINQKIRKVYPDKDWQSFLSEF